MGIFGNAALAQTTSIQGGQFTAVPRVIADINASGAVDTSTSLYGVFDGNNPRSVATVNGSSFYIAGQGLSGSTNQGVFIAQDGASSATAINTSTDMRSASIVGGNLFVSEDSKQAGINGNSNGSSGIQQYTGLPTSAATPTVLPGISNSITLTSGQTNGINTGKVGNTIYLSPESYFFANSTTLYVADSGNPKNHNATATITDGGLQKWSFNLTTLTWNIDYTLYSGLNLVRTSASSGTTGLIGLTGEVVGNNVELFATNATVNDTDATFLYGITDPLAATSMTPGSESFTTLVTAPADTNIRGIAFAPTAASIAVPEPASFALLGAGVLGLAMIRRRKAV